MPSYKQPPPTDAEVELIIQHLRQTIYADQVKAMVAERRALQKELRLAKAKLDRWADTMDRMIR